jgi:hypothetical protein
MPPGLTAEPVAGMSQEKRAPLIEASRYARGQWPPGRRILPEKPTGGKGPLGMPPGADTVVQDLIRSILEASYAPPFSARRPGCRPYRGCPTALTARPNFWVGPPWVIAGDIQGCCDTIDHHTLRTMRQATLRAHRFLRLLAGALQAGDWAAWPSHPSRSGSPPGGIGSPILSSIALDRGETFVADTLMPASPRGATRAATLADNWTAHQAASYRSQGHRERAETIRRQRQQLPAGPPNAPGYRRRRDRRDADAILCGLIGPVTEADAIKARLPTFLSRALPLTLAAEKTLRPPAPTGKARLLGYAIGGMPSPDQCDPPRRRVVTGPVGLDIPADGRQTKRTRYLRDAPPLHRPALRNESDYDIIGRYQGAYRGLVQYDGWAQNLAQRGACRATRAPSRRTTLAGQPPTRVRKAAKRLQGTAQTLEGPRTCLPLPIPREGKRPLVAPCGGLSLKRVQPRGLTDQVITPYPRMRSDIIDRL